MALIKPFPECDWFEIDEDEYLMYLLKGYKIKYWKGCNSIDFYLNGLWHREDGPAMIYAYSSKFEYYYYLGGKEVLEYDLPTQPR